MRIQVACVAAGLIALLGPGSASGAIDVSVTASEVTINSDGSEANLVVVDKTGVQGAFNTSTWEITDTAQAPTTSDGDCSVAANTVTCTAPGTLPTVRATLGGGNDTYGVEGLTNAFVGYVYGEGGTDTLSGFAGADDGGATGFGSGQDYLSGGPGDGDQLTGGRTDDSLDGGTGDNDVLVGNRGGDTFSDVSSANPFEVGVAQSDAGSTGDRVLYTEDARTSGVTVTFDGSQNDGSGDFDQKAFGAAGELDQLGTGVDRIDGTENGDTMTGDSFANELRGGDGADTLTGGNGPDALLGEGGGDTLNAQDGAADQVVNCGGGGTANVDQADPDPVDCATVNGKTSGGGGGGSASDTTAPDTSISGADGQIIDVDMPPAAVTYSLSSTEAGSSFECDVNGSGFRSCPGTVRVLGLIGQHRIAARAKDGAGNVDQTPAQRGFSVRQRPVLRPASRPFDSGETFTMPLVVGMAMERARDRALKAAPAAELKFAFKRGCREASDLEVIAQKPLAGRKLAGDVQDDAAMTLTVCLADSDWLRDCSQVDLAEDLDPFEDRDDFELTYDTALKVTKCRVDYDIRLRKGPDEAYLKLKAQRAASKTKSDRKKRLKAGEINAQLDCPIAPEDQDLRVAYGDGYSPSTIDASVGPRENGPGGWQLPAGYKNTFSLTIIDRAMHVVNATTFIDADGVGAANAPKGPVKYANGQRNISFTPQKPGRIFVCTILETGDEQVLSHAFSIDVVKVGVGDRWTTAGGRVIRFEAGGRAKWLSPQEAGQTARAADLGGFIEWLKSLFGGSSHAVAKTVSGEQRISQKSEVLTTTSKIGTSQIPLAGTLAGLVQPPVSVIGRCLFADAQGTVSVIECKILRAPNGGALIATATDPGSGRIVAAGAGNVLSHNGGTLVAAGAGNLIGLDGGSLIGLDGGSLIGLDGGSLIGLDGASLIGLDGATLAALGADAISIDVAALVREGGSALSPKVSASLIGLDGGSLVAAGAGNVLSHNGGQIVAAGAGN